MKDRDAKALLMKIVKFSQDRNTLRAEKQLMKLCEFLYSGLGFGHEKLEDVVFGGVKFSDAEIQQVQKKVGEALESLASPGGLCAETLSLTNIHAIAGLSKTSGKAFSRVEVSSEQSFPDALIAIVILIMFFFDISIAKCHNCGSLYIRQDKRQVYCSPACKQQNYRNSMSSKEKRKAAMKRSERYYAQKYKQDS